MTKTKCLLFGSLKGGTGKTTINLNCAVGYAREGKKVLVMDFDPQASITSTLRKSVVQAKGNLGTTLWLDKDVNSDQLSKTILESCISNIDFVPATLSLETKGRNLTGEIGREKILLGNIVKKGEKEEVFKKYDLIIFDINPAFDIIAENVYFTCAYRGGVIQVLNDDPYSLQGVIKNIKNWENNFKSDVTITIPDAIKGIVINKAKSSAIMKGMIEQIKSDKFPYKNLVFNTIILDSAIMKKSILKQLDKETGEAKQKFLVDEPKQDFWILPNWMKNNEYLKDTPEGNQIKNLLKEIENRNIIKF